MKDRYRECPHCKEQFYFACHTRHVRRCKLNKTAKKVSRKLKNKKQKKQRKAFLRNTLVRRNRRRTTSSDTPMTREKKINRVNTKECFYCDAMLPRATSSIYQHYSEKHFADQLRNELTSPGSRVCHLCGKKCSNNSIIYHLGVKHEVIKKFLPKHLHLQKAQQEVILPFPEPEKPATSMPETPTSKTQLLEMMKKRHSDSKSVMTCFICNGPDSHYFTWKMT